ncbi:MAG TPA: hypothetical protein VHW45_08455 [Candidatus Sulfotelmatobacter sp.]|nr:hypothetical protein [Candidatus Sulfotelmatobacter sp.]
MRHKAVDSFDRSAVPNYSQAIVITVVDTNDPASRTHSVRGKLPTVVFDVRCKLPGVLITLLTLGVFVTSRQAGREQQLSY